MSSPSWMPFECCPWVNTGVVSISLDTSTPCSHTICADWSALQPPHGIFLPITVVKAHVVEGWFGIAAKLDDHLSKFNFVRVSNWIQSLKLWKVAKLAKVQIWATKVRESLVVVETHHGSPWELNKTRVVVMLTSWLCPLYTHFLPDSVPHQRDIALGQSLGRLINCTAFLAGQIPSGVLTQAVKLGQCGPELPRQTNQFEKSWNYWNTCMSLYFNCIIP